MRPTYLGLRPGDQLRSAGAGGLAGGIVGGAWGVWASANGAEPAWYFLAVYLGLMVATLGVVFGAVYGASTKDPGRDRLGR